MDNLTIGQRIASKRKLANMSQEYLAEQLGVTRQSISKWESDAGLPDIDNLIALSKMFEVSVGWLLGTEKDPNFDPSTGLSDAQLQMVEKIVDKKRVKKWHKVVLVCVALCVLVSITITLLQVGFITKDILANQTQIFDLEEQIKALEQQIDIANNSLDEQKNGKTILKDVITKAYINDDEQTVTISFYLIPKFYQENAQAYIVISDDNIFKNTQIQCQPKGSLYWCNVELPLKNGYSYSFVLDYGSGFQEQQLNDEFYVKPLQNLYDSTRYHLDSDEEVRTYWSVTESEYTFTQAIASPFITFNNGYAGYEAIDVILYHNNVPIYTESLLEAFRDHGGSYMMNEVPLIPNISTELPELKEGDILRLEIVAKCYNSDKKLTNVLETLEVIK